MAVKMLRAAKTKEQTSKPSPACEIILEMHDIEKIVERAKEKTILDVKSKKDNGSSPTVREVLGTFKDNLRKEFAFVLTPELASLNYTISVISPTQVNGDRYTVKYTIPSSIAFVSFVDTKIGIGKIVDKILEIVN